MFDEGLRSFTRGDYIAAVEMLGGALRRDSSVLRAYDYLGLSLSELGYCQDADRAFALGLRRDSANIQLMAHAGQVSFQCGLLDRSKIYYVSLIQLKPNDTRALSSLSQIYLQEGLYDTAITFLRKGLAVDSNSQQLHYLLGSAYRSSKKVIDAIVEYNKALNLNPAYFPCLRDIAFAYLEADSIVYATISFQQALAMQPENASLKMNLANCYFRSKYYRKALSLYFQLEQDPYRQNVFEQEGLCFFYLGKYDTAELKFRIVLAADSTNPGAYFNLGLSLMALHDYRGAIKALRRAALLSKSDLIANAYDRIGTAYYELKSGKAALAAYQVAVRENPKSPRTYFNIGVLYENLFRDKARALESYRRAIEFCEPSGDKKSLYQRANERIKHLQRRD
jgi:superkiller protein 3